MPWPKVCVAGSGWVPRTTTSSSATRVPGSRACTAERWFASSTTWRSVRAPPRSTRAARSESRTVMPSTVTPCTVSTKSAGLPLSCTRAAHGPTRVTGRVATSDSRYEPAATAMSNT